jgi:dipeptidyl aminopeptidase/acylaminoacyl peptidase
MSLKRERKMIRPRLRRLLFLAMVSPLFLFRPGTAQTLTQAEPETAVRFAFPLTIQSIMRGPEVVGVSPSAIRWTDDSRWIYFRWLPGGGAWHDEPDLYRVPAGGGEPEKVEEEVADSLAVLFAPGDLSPNRRLRVSSVGGDIYLVERSSLTVSRLTRTQGTEASPRFSSHGRSIFFTRDGNVFEISLEGSHLRQLTDIRQGPAPREDEEAEGQRAFLEEQQLQLFEYIRRRKEAREQREARQERGREGEPEPVYLARGERAGALVPSPDGAFVMVSAMKPADEARNTIVPSWITESGYTEDLNSRSKVGDAQGESRIGLLEVATGEMAWLDLSPDDGSVSASFAEWNDAGTHGLVASASRDNKARWIFSVHAASGEVTVLDSLRDEAWIGGPCSRCMGWLPGSDRAYFVSEATGFAHLYAVNADGSGREQLTAGEWEVLSVEIPDDGTRFLLHTNEGSPFDQHVYTMEFDGSRRTAVTTGSGSYRATLSPDGRRMAVSHSRPNRPDELFVAPFRPGPELDQVTVSPTAEWLTYPWLEPEIVHFPARDGVQVPARIYRPSDVGAEPNGAAVIFVHGAGYLHNVHNYWSTYYREYMFHHFLASCGYTVLDIDYRGSAGYGRDWRTGIYRWMGGKDLSDHTDGAAYLVRDEGIDPARIGLYGGSYGGFITLMALFTEPDVFTAGAALRSVTDWAHYNHGYTSNILNQPQDDAEAYEKSSPIYFAENFKGHLLIAHGMVDTNVHFSDVVRLAQRLIELGKENWEMAVYPVENHGFVEPSSWTDEYRRIFELFERTISAPGCTQDGGLCPVRLPPA